MPGAMAAFGAHESCPSCGAQMAADQRYCLSCGRRRGEPRLPFMDAVAFMESMHAPAGVATPPPPPPPAEQRSNRMNANAALIAGVATLVLAIGVGFLIGRSGHENATATGGGEVKVVQVGGAPAGGGEAAAATGGEEAGSSPGSGGSKGASKSKGGSGKSAIGEKSTGKATKKAEKNSQEGAHGQTESVETVLHPTEGVELPEAEQKVGDKCTPGTAGCKGEEFTGNFFGE